MTVDELLVRHADLGATPKLVPMARWVDDLVTVYRSGPWAWVWSAATGCRVQFTTGSADRPVIVAAPPLPGLPAARRFPWFEAREAFDYYYSPVLVDFWRQAFATLPSLVIAIEAHHLAEKLL